MTTPPEGLRRLALGRRFAGAALAGACYGLAEGGSLFVEGRLWMSQPVALLVLAAVAGGVVVGVPGAALAVATGRVRPLVGGAAAGAAAIALWEAALLFVTDPPPFQEAPWYVGNPLTVVIGLALAAALLAGARRAPLPVSGVALALLAAVPPLTRLRDVTPGPAEGQRPNLLFITLDTTRADHVGAYGSHVRTPHLDSLAAQGAVFEHATAQAAVTGPSHTTLFTGQGTWSHGSLLNGIPVAPDQELLAEHLLARGYRTGAFVSAYVLEGKLGFARGFQVYDDDYSWPKGASVLLPNRLVATLMRRIRPDDVLERRGGDTVDDALAWLESLPADRPWFLWVHLFDAHGPYEPPPPYDTLYYNGDPRDPANRSMDQVQNVAVYLERSLEGITDVDWVKAQYAGEVSYVDEQVGRLVTAVEARGEAGRTLVVATGDHGESLGEHGVWFNHGDDLFDPSTQVPYIWRFPGKIPAGHRVASPVELTDTVPTLYGLLGLQDDVKRDGRDLSVLWRGEQERVRPNARGLIFDREANLKGREEGRLTRPQLRMVALRNEASLFVYREDLEHFPPALYAHMSPEEDILTVYGRQEGASDQLGLWVAEAQHLLELGAGGVGRSSQELDPATRARLEALGYLDGAE